MTVRVGVIGAGIMGADHINALHRSVSGAQVSLVADIDAERARTAAASAGAAVAVDTLSLIADPRVDAVIIASHDSTHAELAIAAVRCGKPVLCEKPLAPSLADCVRVAEAEAAAVPAGPPLISVGFMRRFDPAYVELKAALHGGECGTPLLVHHTSRGMSSGPGTTNETSITNSAIHELDTVPWLLESPIVDVGWQAPRCSPAAEGFQDPQLIFLRTADGTLTCSELFLNARYGYDIRCEIVGDRGTLALASPARLVRDGDRRRSTAYAADWRPRFGDAYRLEVQAWIDAIAAGRPSPLPTARDSVTTARVAEAVVTSMREGGRRVAVSGETGT